MSGFFSNLQKNILRFSVILLNYMAIVVMVHYCATIAQ